MSVKICQNRAGGRKDTGKTPKGHPGASGDVLGARKGQGDMVETPTDRRIQQLEAAILEAGRFQAAARRAIQRLRDDPSAVWCCPEMAAVKRASMDLTKSLPALRKSV